MTDPLNIIFDDFGIWLRGYMIELSIYFTRALFDKYFVITLSPCQVLFDVEQQQYIINNLHGSEIPLVLHITK